VVRRSSAASTTLLSGDAFMAGMDEPPPGFGPLRSGVQAARFGRLDEQARGLLVQALAA